MLHYTARAHIRQAWTQKDHKQYLVTVDINRCNSWFARFMEGMTGYLGVPLQILNRSQCWWYLNTQQEKLNHKKFIQHTKNTLVFDLLRMKRITLWQISLKTKINTNLLKQHIINDSIPVAFSSAVKEQHYNLLALPRCWQIFQDVFSFHQGPCHHQELWQRYN